MATSKSKEFISYAEWENCAKYDGSDKILKWSEIPEDTIFFLELVEECKVSKFQSFILHFCDRNELPYRAWAPSHFVKELRRRRALNTQPYFVSYGTVEYKNKDIAKFEITYKTTSKEWDIFQ